jgi:hypothetical protein
VSARYLAYALALSPVLLVTVVVVLSKVGVDPDGEDEILSKLEESIAESEWATMLASRMATTPETQKLVARALARRLARSFFREVKPLLK